jgi:hypothetical protein
MTQNLNGTGIDKNAHWGRYQNREDVEQGKQDARDDLALSMAHKALDIPRTKQDDMQIKADKTTNVNGLGAGGVAGIALAAAGLPAALLGLHLWRGPADTKPAPVVETRPVATAPVANQLDSEWDEVLYEEDSGKEVSRVRYRSRSGMVERKTPTGVWVPAPNAKVPQ